MRICQPTGTGVKLREDVLVSTPLDQANIDFEKEGGETYICGNPPFSGRQTPIEQRGDLEGTVQKHKKFDIATGWFIKAANDCLRKRRNATGFEEQHHPLASAGHFGDRCQGYPCRSGCGSDVCRMTFVVHTALADLQPGRIC